MGDIDYNDFIPTHQQNLPRRVVPPPQAQAWLSGGHEAQPDPQLEALHSEIENALRETMDLVSRGHLIPDKAVVIQRKNLVKLLQDTTDVTQTLTVAQGWHDMGLVNEADFTKLRAKAADLLLADNYNARRNARLQERRREAERQQQQKEEEKAQATQRLQSAGKHELEAKLAKWKARRDGIRHNSFSKQLYNEARFCLCEQDLTTEEVSPAVAIMWWLIKSAVTLPLCPLFASAICCMAACDYCTNENLRAGREIQRCDRKMAYYSRQLEE